MRAMHSGAVIRRGGGPQLQRRQGSLATRLQRRAAALDVCAVQLFQRQGPSAEARAAREEILRCIASDDASQAARVGQLVQTLLAAPRPPFRERLLGGGPWDVAWTSGAFLWQVYTSPGQLLTRSSNRASQDFDPAARTALNFGEIAGPAVTVSATGTYAPADPGSNKLPLEVDVEINGGELRAWGASVPVPIRGTGKFWIEYVDEAGIRVFRSPGGGLTMQVRRDVLQRLRGGGERR